LFHNPRLRKRFGEAEQKRKFTLKKVFFVGGREIFWKKKLSDLLLEKSPGNFFR